MSRCGRGLALHYASCLQVKWTAHKTVSELWPDGDAFARAPRYTGTVNTRSERRIGLVMLGMQPGPSSKEDQVAVPNRSSAYSPPSTYPCPTYPPPPGSHQCSLK
eukprot:5279846-Amphidinium_carterae.1